MIYLLAVCGIKTRTYQAGVIFIASWINVAVYIAYKN